MPVKLKIDWNLAFDLYTRGLTYKDIAAQVGCKEVSLRAHGTRNNWREKVASARQAVSRVVSNMLNPASSEQQSLQKQAEAWVNVTACDIKRTAETLIALPVPGNLDGLRKHEEVWGMHVKRGRSTFGLDQAGASVTINVGLKGRGELIPSERVIDVQPEDSVAHVLHDSPNSAQLPDSQG